MNFRRAKWIGDVLVLALLSVYVLVGRDEAPFHGDESSHVFISRDYFYMFHDHDLSRIYWDPNWTFAQEQWERLMTGSVHRLAIGLALDVAGLNLSDINDDWDWQYRVAANTAQGHMPGELALKAARTSSVIFTILSIIAVWGIALAINPNRIVVWTATLAYGTTPMVLLDGRRAMMEGALLFALALVALAALVVVRQQPQGDRDRLQWAYVLFGCAAGVALAAKLNAVFTVAALFVAVALAPAHDGSHTAPLQRPAWRIPWLRRWMMGTFGLMLLTFLLLTPAWWPNVLGVPIEVWGDRVDLIKTQEQEHGSYHSVEDRVEGLLKQAFYGGPSYYESPPWARELLIRQQIRDYEADHLAGRMGGTIWGITLAAAFVVGSAVFLRAARRDAAARLVLLWLWVNVITLLITNPLPWARYYLVVQAPLALCIGVGLGKIVSIFGHSGTSARC